MCERVCVCVCEMYNLSCCRGLDYPCSLSGLILACGHCRVLASFGQDIFNSSCPVLDGQTMNRLRVNYKKKEYTQGRVAIQTASSFASGPPGSSWAHKRTARRAPKRLKRWWRTSVWISVGLQVDEIVVQWFRGNKVTLRQKKKKRKKERKDQKWMARLLLNAPFTVCSRLCLILPLTWENRLMRGLTVAVDYFVIAVYDHKRQAAKTLNRM